MKAFAGRFLVGAAIVAFIVGAMAGSPIIFGGLLLIGVIIAGVWALGDMVISLTIEAISRWRRKDGWS